jgi:hypothetical protein
LASNSTRSITSASSATTTTTENALAARAWQVYALNKTLNLRQTPIVPRDHPAVNLLPAFAIVWDLASQSVAPAAKAAAPESTGSSRLNVKNN